MLTTDTTPDAPSAHPSDPSPAPASRTPRIVRVYKTWKARSPNGDTLALPQEDAGRHLLFTGIEGSGKSAWIEAILLALTGAVDGVDGERRAPGRLWRSKHPDAPALVAEVEDSLGRTWRYEQSAARSAGMHLTPEGVPVHTIRDIRAALRGGDRAGTRVLAGYLGLSVDDAQGAVGMYLDLLAEPDQGQKIPKPLKDARKERLDAIIKARMKGADFDAAVKAEIAVAAQAASGEGSDSGAFDAVAKKLKDELKRAEGAEEGAARFRQQMEDQRIFAGPVPTQADLDRVTQVVVELEEALARWSDHDERAARLGALALEYQAIEAQEPIRTRTRTEIVRDLRKEEKALGSSVLDETEAGLFRSALALLERFATVNPAPAHCPACLRAADGSDLASAWEEIAACLDKNNEVAALRTRLAGIDAEIDAAAARKAACAAEAAEIEPTLDEGAVEMVYAGEYPPQADAVRADLVQHKMDLERMRARAVGLNAPDTNSGLLATAERQVAIFSVACSAWTAATKRLVEGRVEDFVATAQQAVHPVFGTLSLVLGRSIEYGASPIPGGEPSGSQEQAALLAFAAAAAEIVLGRVRGEAPPLTVLALEDRSMRDVTLAALMETFAEWDGGIVLATSTTRGPDVAGWATVRLSSDEELGFAVPTPLPSPSPSSSSSFSGEAVPTTPKRKRRTKAEMEAARQAEAAATAAGSAPAPVLPPSVPSPPLAPVLPPTPTPTPPSAPALDVSSDTIRLLRATFGSLDKRRPLRQSSVDVVALGLDLPAAEILADTRLFITETRHDGTWIWLTPEGWDVVEGSAAETEGTTEEPTDGEPVLLDPAEAAARDPVVLVGLLAAAGGSLSDAEIKTLVLARLSPAGAAAFAAACEEAGRQGLVSSRPMRGRSDVLLYELSADGLDYAEANNIDVVDRIDTRSAVEAQVGALAFWGEAEDKNQLALPLVVETPPTPTIEIDPDLL